MRRKRRSVVVALVAGALSGACVAESPPAAVTSFELGSPAGPASGEPFLSSQGDAVYMSWLEKNAAGTHQLRYARFTGAHWSAARVIAESDRFLVNWADFPSLRADPTGTLWAHWLERGPEGGYAYGIRLTHSEDGGDTWSDPWTPHEDGTPTEHGFVSAIPVDGGMGFLWLDGRSFVDGPDGSPATREMSLRFRSAGPRQPGPETVVDARVCDCCQTDAAMTSAGPVAVYRGRTADEIRDIQITMLQDDVWSEGEPVHEDGWETGACPVNGPAVDAIGDEVVVAWFTAADNHPVVKLARSRNAGRRFGAPVVVDDAAPAGRVDVVMLDDRSALVSWLARAGGEAAEVRVMRIDARGRKSPAVGVSRSTSERASGFPRMARAGDGTILLAWTDVAELEPRVRVARIETEE